MSSGQKCAKKTHSSFRVLKDSEVNLAKSGIKFNIQVNLPYVVNLEMYALQK